MADIKIFTPASYLGNIIELCTKKRGKQTDLQYRTNSVEISFNIPLSEIIYDFFDNLKSLSKGYASYDYVITDYVESEMIRLDILVNKKRIDALSQIMHKDDHYRKARATIDNLKTLIPRQMFEINIQGCIGAKVIGTVGSDEKIEIAKANGYENVINYSKDDFTKEVMKLTNNNGVSAVFDGVGKDTFKGSIECLKPRGMMVSFGNASGPLDPVNVPKDIQSKSLFFTRPTIGHYFTNRNEIQKGADEIFEKIKFGMIKIKIFKEYSLSEAKQAHIDLESRKLTGPAILIPNGK